MPHQRADMGTECGAQMHAMRLDAPGDHARQRRRQQIETDGDAQRDPAFDPVGAALQPRQQFGRDQPRHDAARKRARPASRSAIRSAGSSSPMCSRTAGPAARQRVALR